MKSIGIVMAGGLGRRMGGSKPKVLYEVDGVPMVNRALSALSEGGAQRLVAVLSHKADEVADALLEGVETVVQQRPRGTASGILESDHIFSGEDSAVVVSFGDMPWVNPKSAKRLIDAIEAGADAAVLTYNFEDPPQFGRIIRDDAGDFMDIVQFKDLADDQREIRELDAGMFAFRSGPLRDNVKKLDSNNAAGELYLTSIPTEIRKAGGTVDCVPAEQIEEALGVNDPHHLEFAQRLGLLRSAEEILGVADDIYNEVVPTQRHPATIEPD